MNEQEKKEKLKEHMLVLRHWMIEAPISDDESQYQVLCIDELLEEIGEGV